MKRLFLALALMFLSFTAQATPPLAVMLVSHCGDPVAIQLLYSDHMVTKLRQGDKTFLKNWDSLAKFKGKRTKPVFGLELKPGCRNIRSVQ